MINPAAPIVLATPPQISFIRVLLGQREVDEDRRTTLEAALAAKTLRKGEASLAITTLKNLPFKKAPVFTAAAPTIDPRRKAVLDALADIPHSNYAIPTSEVDTALTNTNVSGNDYLFVTVREYRGTLYMRRLHGAPGYFTKSQISITDALTIARILADKPERYALLFSEHHGVCARCSADLTDQTSREMGLGPTCRKAFGL